MTDTADLLRQATEHYQFGHLDVAEELCRQVVAVDPDNARAWRLLGARLAAARRWEQAADCFRTLIELHPEDPTAHQNLGLACQSQGDFAAAADSHRTAIALEPRYAEAHGCLGVALQHQGQLAQAKACYLRALELNPHDPGAQYNLATALVVENKLNEAEECLRSLLERVPDDVGARALLNTVLVKRCEWSDVLEGCQQVLAARPNDAEAHYYRGMARLAHGDLGGWSDYEAMLSWSRRKREQPAWDGARLAGQRLLVHAQELGLGDVLQFIRYLPLVERQVDDVQIEIPSALRPLLAESGYKRLVSPTAEPVSYDQQVFLLSLPRILKTTPATIPANGPYLSANARLVDLWRTRLEPHRGFRIGIVWQGADGWTFYNRSAPLAVFEPLARVPGVSLVSLQKRVGLEQLATLGDRFRVVDFGDQLDETHGAFMDSAALAKSLDLVITCDTATAHLAGGLGAPVWVALPYRAEWRWLLDRDDSPWYPTMRLFRQRQPGDWTELFERMAAELGGLVTGRSSR